MINVVEPNKSVGFFFFLRKVLCKVGEEEILCQHTFQESTATEKKKFFTYPSIVNLLVPMIQGRRKFYTDATLYNNISNRKILDRRKGRSNSLKQTVKAKEWI